MSTNQEKNLNLEFSRVKLLGYYEDNLNSRITEIEFPDEAEELYQLFSKSFNSIQCIKSIDSDFRNILLGSELIFKNTHGKLISFSEKEKCVKISNVIYNSHRIIRVSWDYQFYFTPGEPYSPPNNGAEHYDTKREIKKVKATIKDIVYIDGYYYYQLIYAGLESLVKLFPFELQIIDSIRKRSTLDCVYLGLDNDGNPKLMQDRDSYIDELFEKDTVQYFSYINSAYDIKGNTPIEYHWVRDSYGLKHRFYGELSEEKKVYGNQLELYIRRIDPRTKKLSLTFYNPNLDKDVKEWYSAERIFTEINDIENKELFFDCYFSEDQHKSKLVRDLVGQYSGKSNLWLFTYLNVLDNELVGVCIRKRKIEELAIVSQIMIKLQEWMVEKSTFLDLFTSETKDDIILKSTSQIRKYQRMLLAIDIVKKGRQSDYINNIVSSIQKSGRKAIRRDERIEILTYILKVNPEYIIQDIESTSNIIRALLSLEDDILKYQIDGIINLLNYYIEYNTRIIRKTTVRTNDIDTSKILIIKEILSLLGLKILILQTEKWHDELQGREAKARFFRFLSFICKESMQATILEAAINALVGVINDKEIFTWENVTRINPINLANLTANAAVLDCNLENDYHYCTGKSGALSLDPTGFTIIPYKQSMTALLSNVYLYDVNIIHNLESLPLKLGSMFNFKKIEIEDDPIEQYLLWDYVTRHPNNLMEADKPLPSVGDSVKVIVKEQTQPDKLKHMIFVTVIDKNYRSVDGIIMIKEVSSKWIDDARTIFKPGDILYAKVCKVENEKYNFSIKNEADKNATISSTAADDARCLVINKKEHNDNNLLPKGFIQELILLVDMRIRKEDNMKEKLTLIGYAFCLSVLVGDPKSYYYDFMLRYYACINKFLTGNYQDVSITFSKDIGKYFKSLSSKLHLAELMTMAENNKLESINSLSKLAASEEDNDVMKITSMLLTYIYAQRANLSNNALITIKSEINKFISNHEELDLSSLDEFHRCNTSDNDDVLLDDDIIVIQSNNVDSGSENNENCNASVLSNCDKETTDLQGSFLPLNLGIFDDNSVIIGEYNSEYHLEGAIFEFSIKEYARNGSILIVNNNAGISKIPISSLQSYTINKPIKNCINPYKLSNHFIVAEECIIGLIITTDSGKFIEMWNTASLEDSNINDIKYTKSQCDCILRHQAFILPSDNQICGIEQYTNKSTIASSISETIVESLESYGIFIKD